MTEIKARRHRAIREMIRAGRYSRQDEVARDLADQGFTVTQATVSRDLDELGAVKLRRDGALAYALPDLDEPGADREQRLAAIVGEWVRSVEEAGNMVVLKTPPGSAHLVGVALDRSATSEVVGSICGDDTIFVATRSDREAAAVAERFREFL